MCVKLNSLFDSEMKVYYVTHTNYILKFRNTKSQIYLGTWVKIKVSWKMSVNNSYINYLFVTFVHAFRSKNSKLTVNL